MTMRRWIAAGCIGALGFVYVSMPPPPVPNTPPYQRLPHTPYDSHPNKHFLTQVPKTIGVIGGGTAGLTTAKVLSQQGFTVEVLEKGTRIGGVWADNYENAGLQAPFPNFNMPDHAFPEGTPLLPRLPQVRDFLDAYAEKFNLQPLVTLNAEVAEVSQHSDGTWTVTLKDGAKKSYDFLVLGTGMYFKPHIPIVPGLETFSGKALHSFDVRDGKSLFAGKRVVVVGGGKSAYDVMRLASDNGAQVTCIMRSRIWSLDIEQTVGGWPVAKILACRLGEVLALPPDMPHSPLLRPFSWLYWTFLERQLKKGLPEVLLPTTELRRQRFINLNVRDNEVVARIASGQIPIVTGAVSHVHPTGVEVQGQSIPADVLVFATGFEANTLGFGPLWLYRGVLLPEVRNFAAIGYIGVTFFNQLKNGLQAVWLAEVLRGAVRLPSVAAMKAEVETRKQAVQEAYSESPALAPYSWPEIQLYDTLLTDMGLRVFRKHSILDEWIELLRPEDYKPVFTHRV